MLSQEKQKQPVVAVVGGGVAGATAALHFAELGNEVILIEKGDALVSGPPICHLHAGGNLYREIDLQQCLELLEQSINTVRLYPFTLNKRPTVIATPHSDGGEPLDIVPRLETIKKAYQSLVEQDPRNRVIGDPETYFKLYSYEELVELSHSEQPSNPTGLDDWVIPFAQNVDLETLKYPVAVVQEYGWSVFRLAASVSLALEHLPNCKVRTSTTLDKVEETESGWKLHTTDRNGASDVEHADYLVNACGFETGTVDDLAKRPRKRLVEFKAAYVTQWESCQQQWPEVIFHGPRGTQTGMAQLTPYAGNIFQLHGMTEDITLFKDGLVASNNETSQPQLPLRLKDKIKSGWQPQTMEFRSQKAIDHVSQFIPPYKNAVRCGKPLFGAQQIPGDDETLRAADVSFEGSRYARLEIVKGSSALPAAYKISERWKLVSRETNIGEIEQDHPISMSLSHEQVEQKAIELAKQRHYPIELAMTVGEA